jgi:RNA polymerase sigma-70 factor (ECF subfamily)
MSTQAVADLDAQLMCRVREGDIQSYSLLMQRHRRPVIHFVHRMVQNQAVAEELAQEVFLRVYRSRGSYEPTAKFSTWLFRIATHVALNSLRNGRYEQNRESLDQEPREGLYRQFRDSKPTVEEMLLAGIKTQQIRDEIENLPPNQRAAVILHKYQELDYAQIACVLQCSESAVKSLLFRAYERLRARLAHFNGQASLADGPSPAIRSSR